MNISSNRTLQLLAFSIATLLATSVLVLAGLNERGDAPGCVDAITCTTSDSR